LKDVVWKDVANLNKY